MKTVAEKIKERAEEQRELERLIPLHRNKHRLPKRVPKSALWSRTERQAMAAMAEQHLKDRRDAKEQT